MSRPPTPARVRALAGGLAALFLALALPACTVRLTSPYDAETDHAVTVLHRRVETLLTHIERTAGTPAGAFPVHAATYDSVRVDLRALRLRASARPQNELQDQQLATTIEGLGVLAVEGAINATLAVVRDTVNTAVGFKLV